MLDAFYIGATGMQAQQAHVEAIANNLANVNTAGFKKARISFADMVTGSSAVSGISGEGIAPLPEGVGVRIVSSGRIFAGGELKKTDAPLDVAIAGDGFIELAMADGSRAYARGGSLRVNADGLLCSQGGIPLKPAISVPENAEALLISAGGRVQVRMPGSAAPADVGQIELVRFANPQGLAAQGGNVYRATEVSGQAVGGRPGEDGMGALAQGFLENSNVKLVEEMVDLLVAQRAYEASAKVVQAGDDMLGMINALRK